MSKTHAFRLLALAPALLLALEPAGAARRGTYGERLGAAAETAQRAASQERCGDALAALRPLMAEREFATLPETTRGALHALTAWCAIAVGETDRALEDALAATGVANADPSIWILRLGLELDAGKHDDALTTLEALAARLPDALNQVDPDWFYGLWQQLGRVDDDALSRRYLALVTSPQFRNGDNLPGIDGYRAAYARQLLKTDEKEAAGAQLARITAPWALLDLSLDPVIRPLLPGKLDMRAATEREIARLQERAALRPDLLSIAISIASMQRTLGRAEEAVATLEAAKPEGLLASQFSDLGRQRNWWWDALARSYEQLGRYNDAVAAYEQAIAGGEGRGANVSQVINLAYLHQRFGNDEAALETLARFDGKASPYGLMEYHLAHGCAAFGAGRPDEGAPDLAYATEHENDHPEALADLQLCAGQEEAAAGTLIRMLADSERRSTALRLLSEFEPLPAGVPPTRFDEGHRRLGERPDVKAAAERAGGTGRFNVLRPL